MGQKMVRFGELRGTRSRQDASKEVHEAGRIRPSSGSNGGHVLSLYPLIWRSLACGARECGASRNFGLEVRARMLALRIVNCSSHGAFGVTVGPSWRLSRNGI